MTDPLLPFCHTLIALEKLEESARVHKADEGAARAFEIAAAFVRCDIARVRKSLGESGRFRVVESIGVKPFVPNQFRVWWTEQNSEGRWYLVRDGQALFPDVYFTDSVATRLAAQHNRVQNKPDPNERFWRASKDIVGLWSIHDPNHHEVIVVGLAEDVAEAVVLAHNGDL